MGNHGLWLALTVFMVARGVTLIVQLPALERGVAASPSSNAL
jgi:MATE family multidrug resistance protein